MAKSKKITVRAVSDFFDKKENKKRSKNDVFEVTEKRFNEIKAFEKENKLELIEIATADKCKESEDANQ